jgi:flavin reductase (DIM6/NTAB) family NADH-FMN oxidoreductase RutF
MSWSEKMDEREIASAVGNIPSGLFIVCSLNEDGTKDGYLASWVQQISFKPLLVSLALTDSRPGYDHIMDKKTFTINIVGGHETGYLKYFWKGYPKGEGPFDQIPHKISSGGGIIIEDAKAIIECRLKESFKPGDHEMAICEVLASYTQHGDAKSKIHLRKNGLDY